jgi:hypothetical protein
MGLGTSDWRAVLPGLLATRLSTPRSTERVHHEAVATTCRYRGGPLLR